MLLLDTSPELAQRLARAWEELPYLVRVFKHTRRLLDIGCGAGVTSVLLAKHINLDLLYLMDGGPERRREKSWFDGMPNAWTNPQLAADMARINGVNYIMMPPDPEAQLSCDGIMSLLSWGHHYPVTTYIELARRTMATKLVVDLRKGMHGLETFRANGFYPAEQLAETDKTERWHLGRLF